MTTPAPQPGWHPDPSGMPMLRYFDGTQWTGQLAPMNAPPPQRGPAAVDMSRGAPMRKWVTLAVAGPIAFTVTLFLMQLAFGAAADSGSLLLEVIGFGLFLLFLAGIVATVVGGIGVVRGLLRRR